MLPNGGQAYIDPAKITHYLLSPTYQDGIYKADFFTRFGFSLDQWERLADALLTHSTTNRVSGVINTPFGTKYNVDGVLETPDGRNPRIRTAWIIAPDSDAPKFVTARPLRGRRNEYA